MPPVFAFGSVNLSGTVLLGTEVGTQQVPADDYGTAGVGFAVWSPVEGVSMVGDGDVLLALQCTARSQIINVGNDNYS